MPSLSYYQSKKESYELLVTRQKKAIKKIAFLRLSWFLIGVIGIAMATNTNYWVLGAMLALFIGVFVALLVKHTRALALQEQYKAYVNVYTKECAILNHQFQDYDTGMDFYTEQHPYAKDLDVLGKNSLFQYLNRTFSKQGRHALAQRLLQALPTKKLIEQHQESIQELSKDTEWIESFLAQGILCATNDNDAEKSLAAWAQNNSNHLPNIWKYLLPILVVLNMGIFIISLFGFIPPILFGLYIMIIWGIIGSQAKKINAQHNSLSKQHKHLQNWQQLFAILEQKPFKAARLKRLQSFFNEQETASKAIQHLSKLSQAFDTRLNIFGWLVLNYFLLWDIRQSLRLETWKQQHAQAMPQWFAAVAEIEADISFAMFAMQRGQSYPNIQDTAFAYQAQEASHPLMPKNKCVPNPIDIAQAPCFRILTGANMAGKSTYLRTIGCNLILALAGSAVCAKQMAVSPIQIYTSIKTTDSLAKNESYFYAELRRLQTMIQRLEQGDKLFIILDEILKGTNSHDKAIGSKALVQHLVDLQTSGIIATHDLSLGQLAKDQPRYVHNSCFEVDIVENELVFDYKLRQGISQNLNASFLMKKMRIV